MTGITIAPWLPWLQGFTAGLREASPPVKPGTGEATVTKSLRPHFSLMGGSLTLPDQRWFQTNNGARTTVVPNQQWCQTNRGHRLTGVPD